jgi:hypothetical protein
MEEVEGAEAVKRFIKPVPLSEPLCRPQHSCQFQAKCQRFLQQPSGAQKLGDFTDQHYNAYAGFAPIVRCGMFVRIEFQDDAPAPPRKMRHWTQP